MRPCSGDRGRFRSGGKRASSSGHRRFGHLALGQAHRCQGKVVGRRQFDLAPRTAFTHLFEYARSSHDPFTICLISTLW